MSRARSGSPRAANARWYRSYSARPAGVSIAIGSNPSSRRSYGLARMSISRMATASSKPSAVSSAGVKGASLKAHL